MFRIKRAKQMQLGYHLRSDPLRLPIFRPAMYHAMPHGCQRSWLEPLLHPIHQHFDGDDVISHDCPPGESVSGVKAFHREVPLRQSDAFDLARKNPLETNIRYEQRKLDA